MRCRDNHVRGNRIISPCGSGCCNLITPIDWKEALLGFFFLSSVHTINCYSTSYWSLCNYTDLHRCKSTKAEYQDFHSVVLSIRYSRWSLRKFLSQRLLAEWQRCNKVFTNRLMVGSYYLHLRGTLIIFYQKKAATFVWHYFWKSIYLTWKVHYLS